MGTSTEAVPRAGSPARRWAARGAGLYAVIFVLLLARPVNHSDESWFLWIAHRVAHGQVLYRDVYSVTTPLPTWLASIGVWLFGTQILVVRALSVACITTSALLALVIAGRCGLGRRGRTLLLIGIVLAGSPLAHFASIYSQLAITGTLATLAGLMAWLECPAERSEGEPSDDGRGEERPRRRRAGTATRLLIGAGFAAAVSFASKPNIGVLTLAALVTVVTVHTVSSQGWRAARRALVTVVAPFAVVVGLMLAIIAAQGAFGAFVSDVFSDKPEYVRVLGVSLLPGSTQLQQFFTGARGFSIFLDTQGLVVLGVLVVVAWSTRRTWRARRAHSLALALFTLVAIVAAYPEAGPQHLTETMPLLLATAAAAVALAGRSAPREDRRWARVAVGGLAAWLAVGGVLFVGVLVEQAPYALQGDNPHHFAGTIAFPHWHTHSSDLRVIRRLTGGTVFMLSTEASFYYLAGGLRNPLPYDFPELSDFGGGGELGVTHRIAAGNARWVCIGHRPHHAGLGPTVRPVLLERWVRRHLEIVAHLRLCDLYRDHHHKLLPSAHSALTFGSHTAHGDGVVVVWDFVKPPSTKSPDRRTTVPAPRLPLPTWWPGRGAVAEPDPVGRPGRMM